MTSIHLDKQQQMAVYYDEEKPLVIQAGPGAGKTRVIVERVKYLINDKKISPESLLVITFTNKAAKELKQRLSKDLPTSTINNMQISTIHSFCNKVLSYCGYSGLELLEDTDVNEKKMMFLRKHKKDLGFKDESYMTGSGLKSVISTFDEYATFKVDTDALTNYIEEEFPVEKSYLEFIKEKKAECDDYFQFPYDEVKSNKEYDESWYNAKYKAVAQAYPKYIKLLEEEGLCDYNFLQIKTNQLLEDEELLSNIRFKNVLIDEFQDTDPIQMQIFEKLMKVADSFTVVGDDDQSIYSFRGSVPEYFTHFRDKYDANIVTLNTNYRSTRQIVEFNESFIKDDRLIKKNLKPNRTDESDVYYLNNADGKQQAQNIVTILKHLKQSGKIGGYSDVGILFRAIRSKSYLQELLDELCHNGIPYYLKDSKPLIEYDEVKAILTLIWYVIEKNPQNPSNIEKKWLNLKAFTNEYYDASKIFKLSDDTINTLTQLEDDYRNKVTETEKLAYKELTGKTSKIKKFEGVFNRDDEVIAKIFESVEYPDISKMTSTQLKDIGITDDDDLEFFERLHNIKCEAFDEDVEFYERPTILETYYKLLDATGYIRDKFDDNTYENKQILYNVAQISNTIFNYENLVNKWDITGLFWLLTGLIEDYGSHSEDEDENNKVQIMTIHKSKGLEFPVVILCSLEESKFPRKYVDPTVKSFYNMYPTPYKYLEYKDESEDMEEHYDKEERRTIYVATTRAEDMLILSSISKDDEVPTIVDKMFEDYPSIISLNDSNLPKLPQTHSHASPKLVDERLDISYTSFSEYNFCPHEYNLRYNYNFQNSKNKQITYGLFVHSILNNIHNISLKQEITDEKINNIIDKNLSLNENINNEDPQIESIRSSILEYWNTYGSKWDILGSEVPFDIINGDARLSGSIDLIIRNSQSNNITVIDFKTSNLKKLQKDKLRYQRQLYIYAMAIRENPQFKDYNVTMGMIYTVYDSGMLYFDIDDEKIDQFSRSINQTVKKIKNEEYDRHKNNCSKCEFKDTVCQMLD